MPTQYERTRVLNFLTVNKECKAWASPIHLVRARCARFAVVVFPALATVFFAFLAAGLESTAISVDSEIRKDL